MRIRYCFIVMKLSTEVIEELTNLLESIAKENPYGTNETMMRDLIINMELVSKTPYQLLR